MSLEQQEAHKNQSVVNSNTKTTTKLLDDNSQQTFF